MSENSVLYEITQMIQDKNTVENDMKEIMDTVAGVIQKKYVSRLQEAINTHRQMSLQSPTKEVQLIKALKPFAAQENQAAMEKLADMMLMMSTIKSLNSELSSISGNIGDNVEAAELNAGEFHESVHDNGVYDVDDKCLLARKDNTVGMAGIILMMSLFK